MQWCPRRSIVGADVDDVRLTIHILTSFRQEASTRLQPDNMT